MKLNNSLFLLTILVFSISLFPAALAEEGEIVVTDAESVWTTDLIPTSPDVIDSTDALPNNLIKWAFVSHADSIWHAELSPFGVASAKTIYVPDDYAKIQWAVDNASAGDTIIVRDGTYIENVDVNKSLTIKSENGADSTIVQAAKSWDDVFEVTTNYVNISGFNVNGSDGYLKAGIYLNYTNHCNISGNNASNNYEGIYLLNSSNNDITNNCASNNGEQGILLYNSNNNTLQDNNALNNDEGIYLYNSSSNNIENNK